MWNRFRARWAWGVLLLLDPSGTAEAQDILPQTARAPITDIRSRPLTPDLVPPVSRQPFRWGRLPETHRRVGRSACGLPWADYDRTIPRVVARAVSFRTTGPENIESSLASRLLLAGGRSSYGELSKVRPEQTDPYAVALAAESQVTSTVRFKRFVLTQRQVVAAPFVLDRVGVEIYDDGRVLGTGDLVHTGGIEASERGGPVAITVRGLAAGPDVNADPLGPGVVALWSISQETWAPRGGPTPITLKLDALDDPYRRAQVAAGFLEATHIEVTLAPRDIR